MEITMTQSATEATTETAGQTSADTSTEATTTETNAATAGETTEGEAALGDAGKKALDAMKAERKAAKDEAAALKAQLDALQAKVDGKEAEHAAQQAAQAVKDEALKGANSRILKAEFRAAAAGKLTDPADALVYIPLDKFEVNDDGEVDADAITAAIDELITKKPYLAAQGKRFQGGADGGTRNGTTTSIDDQIAEATKVGNHQLAIALKQQRSADQLAKK